MDSRRAVLIRFSPDVYDALKTWADQHSFTVTAAMNVIVAQALSVPYAHIDPVTTPPAAAPTLDTKRVIDEWQDDEEELNIGT